MCADFVNVTMDMVNNGTFYTTELYLSSTVPPPTGIYSEIWLNTLIVSMVILMTVSIVGNTMIIVATILYKSMRTKTNIAILNLAVADIGVTVLDMPVSLISVIKHGENWLTSHLLCDINSFCNALFLIASIHSLMYISVHKYFSLVKPLDHAITKRRTIAMIFVAWFTGFICGIGPILGWTTNEFKYEQGATQCGPMFPMTLQQKSHSIFTFVVGLFIPLAVLIFTYTAIFIEVHRFSKRLIANTSFTEIRIMKQKIRITVTLFILVVAFLFCWSPYMIYACWVLVKGYESVPIWFNSFAYWSGYLSCAINPIIYAWRTKTFRTAFLNIIQCKSKMDKITAELSPHLPKKYLVVGAMVTGPAINDYQQSPRDTSEEHMTASKNTKSASESGHMLSRIKSSIKKMSEKEDRKMSKKEDRKMSKKENRKLPKKEDRKISQEDWWGVFSNSNEPHKDDLQMSLLKTEKGGNKSLRSVFSCPGTSSVMSFNVLDVQRQFSV
ncbi:octopamine receptor beta-2R-like [Anneissia japonica]|uniref:octopamine receptor beta-2R-like n=1 Tax=Anneissia japonica TaxID=1529436 RepID=UPI0014258F3F|nr:octopamine receptor beta-2R-like [Anneissia japonica]